MKPPPSLDAQAERRRRATKVPRAPPLPDHPGEAERPASAWCSCGPVRDRATRDERRHAAAPLRREEDHERWYYAGHHNDRSRSWPRSVERQSAAHERTRAWVPAGCAAAFVESATASRGSRGLRRPPRRRRRGVGRRSLSGDDAAKRSKPRGYPRPTATTHAPRETMRTQSRSSAPRLRREQAAER